MTFKKHKYLFVDIIFLLIITSIPIILKDYISDVLKNRKDAIYLTLLSNIIFLSIYILRYFFRPTHSDIVELYGSNWEIARYYSKYSLKDPNVYNKSYSRFVKFNISSLFLLLIFTITYYSVFGKLDGYLFPVFFVLSVILQVFSWVLTYILEVKENK